MTMIAYTKDERETINKAWALLMAHAEVNGSNGALELADALHGQRRNGYGDLIGAKAQLLGLIVQAGDIPHWSLFSYLPPARTAVAYAWRAHRRFMDKQDYSHDGTWDNVLAAASRAKDAHDAWSERRLRSLEAEVK